MNIIQMSIKDIIPYEKNAKEHGKVQINNVAESIKQFGFAQPLVIDKDNNLIIGHCRLLAAKKLKLREVPVVRMDELTEEQARKLRLLDNKLNESEWDIDLVLSEIADLDFTDFDIDWISNDAKNDSDGSGDDSDIAYKEHISVVIDCESEEEAETIFNNLQEEGYVCRISIL